MVRIPVALLTLTLAAGTSAQPAPFALGGPQEDVAYAVDVTPDGAFAIGGTTFGGYDADPGPGETVVPSGGSKDGFAAVYGPDGTLRFVVPFGPPGPSAVDDVFDVALGPSGELAVVGQVGETLDLDPGPGETIIEAPGFAVYVFVAIYAPDGALRTGFTLPGADFEQRGYVAFDDAGDLYVAVSVSNPTDLDPGPGEAVVDGFRSATLASYTGAGAFRWGFALDGAQYRARGLDVAGDRVALTGNALGTVDVDPGPAVQEITGEGITNWLTATYTTDGALASAFVVGGSAFGTVSDVALDADGGIALVGTIDRDADFDPGPGSTILSGTGNGFDGLGAVAAYAPDATLRYAFGVGTVRPRGVALADGRLVYTGHFEEDFDADPGAGEAVVVPVAGYDVVTVSLDAAGAFEWASPVLGAGTGDNGLGVALTGGQSIVTGRFSDAVDVDPGAGVVELSSDSRSDFDVFVVAYDRAGALAALPTATDEAPDEMRALTVGPSPTAGPATVRLRGWPAARVEVVDLLGRSVAVLHDGPVRDGLVLATPALAPGLYVVRAWGPEGTASARLVLAR
ncbi:hypothetical protein [Rubrivirga sp.]|uniref:hypothetical protein n=1 Tax=Rubrivirga sp. TaxID=1885344 RepID=UPI003B52F49B